MTRPPPPAKDPAAPKDSLGVAIDTAIAGDTRPLYALLARGSGLPGPRPNLPLLEVFADECRSRGAAVDRLILAMASLDADEAPGATALEFIPMCGVAGMGARAAADDKAFPTMLGYLHEAAEDLRFRVREIVIAALARVGEKRGPALVDAFSAWTDGYFHAAAVLSALAEPRFLASLPAAEPALARLDEAFTLARNASRSDVRYPGHKALVEALGKAPAAIAGRFGVPVFDLLITWTTVKEPALRDAIAQNLRGSKLTGRYSSEIAKVHAALTATTPAPRDPRHDVGPTRGRGKRGRR